MRIAVVGAGFVGEATGRGFIKHRHPVVFIDTSIEKVKTLRDQGLEAYLPHDYSELTTDVTMFSVPTPTEGKNFRFDFLKRALIDFSSKLKKHNKYHIIVVRSTVPPGTTRESVIPLIEKESGKQAGKDFGVVMQPEYLREATASDDFERPWFVLIGEHDRKSGAIIDKLYRSFDVPIHHCSLEEAEIQKYVHNVFNAVKIAFFNEIRVAVKKLGWDAEKIFLAAAESCEGIWNPIYGLRDHGPSDGSCLPKDARALLEWGERHNFQFNILRSVISENIRHEELLGTNKQVRVNYLANIEV